MPSKIMCRVLKGHGSYNAGEIVGLTFAEYSRAMRQASGLFEALPDQDYRPTPPPAPVVLVPDLAELVKGGEHPAIARGMVARQKALKAGKTPAEADSAAAEAVRVYQESENREEAPSAPADPEPAAEAEAEAEPDTANREEPPSGRRRKKRTSRKAK